MERISDNLKRHPLLVVGELPGLLSDPVSLSLESIGVTGTPDINNYYVLVALPLEKSLDALARLEAARLSPEQVIILLAPEVPFSHPRLPFLGTLEKIEGENADEFRNRLLGRLDAQRQKKLLYVLHEAAQAGLSRKLSEAELLQALDSARIAHALACSYSLPPASHEKVLRASLAGVSIPQAPWRNETTAEQLIIETAAIIFDCVAKGKSFRDTVRERTAALPFKMRTEHLHHIESCLGMLHGGKSHVA